MPVLLLIRVLPLPYKLLLLQCPINILMFTILIITTIIIGGACQVDQVSFLFRTTLLLLSPVLILMFTTLITTMMVIVISTIIVEVHARWASWGVAVRRGTHCPCSGPAPPYCWSVTSYSIIPYSSIL